MSIFAKAAQLEDHGLARWERSYEDFKSFYQGVAKRGSAHSHKTSESTQLKEFYVLTSRQFVACDVHNNGHLGKEEFAELLRQSGELHRRFGEDWYGETKFEDLQED